MKLRKLRKINARRSFAYIEFLLRHTSPRFKGYGAPGTHLLGGERWIYSEADLPPEDRAKEPVFLLIDFGAGDNPDGLKESVRLPGEAHAYPLNLPDPPKLEKL